MSLANPCRRFGCPQHRTTRSRETGSIAADAYFSGRSLSGRILTSLAVREWAACHRRSRASNNANLPFLPPIAGRRDAPCGFGVIDQLAFVVGFVVTPSSGEPHSGIFGACPKTSSIGSKLVILQRYDKLNPSARNRSLWAAPCRIIAQLIGIAGRSLSVVTDSRYQFARCLPACVLLCLR